MRTSRHRIAGSRAPVAALAAGLLLALALAAPALAADGVRVVPTSDPYGTSHQYGADVSGPFVAYVHGSIPPGNSATIALKHLESDASPMLINPLPSTLFQWAPRVLYHDGTVYVVWVVSDLVTGDQDIWIWQGTYDPGTESWTPVNGTFPKALVTGPAGTHQSNPAIGLVDGAVGDHVVVAWEDTREFGSWVPRVYCFDLTEAGAYLDSSWVGDLPANAGTAVDPTDFEARGQRAPDVGWQGVFWLDDRWSFWNEGALNDTAVLRLDMYSGGPLPELLHWDDDHTYDNGLNADTGGGPRATATGAVWLRRGPYGDRYQVFARPVGGSGALLAPVVRPLSPDAWYQPGTTKTAYAFAAAHDNDLALDYDIFFYDPTTKQRVAVCDQGSAVPAPLDYSKMQMMPAIGPAPGGYRVVWSDQRDSAVPGDEEGDDRLYEAFVPTVSFSSSRSTVTLGSTVSITGTVAPNFSGAQMRLERVTLGTKYGRTIYKSPRALLTTKTLGLTSSASWKWKPSARGTYYLRVYFFGGTKYGPDGVTTADVRLVPHVPNVSKTVKIVVR